MSSHTTAEKHPDCMYSCESAVICKPCAVPLCRYNLSVQEDARRKQCPSVKLCQDKASNPRTDPPGSPVLRTRQRGAGIQGPGKAEAQQRPGWLSEHTGKKG